MKYKLIYYALKLSNTSPVSIAVDTTSSGSLDLDSNSVGVNGIISGIPYSLSQSQRISNRSLMIVDSCEI